MTNNEWLLCEGWGVSAYRSISIFPVFQRVAVNIRDSGAAVFKVIPDLGNDPVGIREIMTNPGNVRVDIRAFMVESRNADA